MEPSIIEKIKGKRLVFTVTPGRNGSHYLAELLALLPKVTSCHEPTPYFWEAMRPALETHSLARAFWLEQKLPEIAKALDRIYVEMSRFICKGFLETLHDYQLCYWCCLETERRTKIYADRVLGLGGRVVDTSIDALSDSEGLKTFLCEMGLPKIPWMKKRRFNEQTQRVVNPKKGLTNPLDPSLDLDALEKEVRDNMLVSV